MIDATIELIAVDGNATLMPQGKHVRPRINFALPSNSKEALEQWAKEEHRTVSNLVEALTEEALKTKQIRSSGSTSAEDLDLIKKFIGLLLGERDRNGVSFVLLGQILDTDPEKLHELYQLVQQCRTEHKEKGRAKK